MYFIPRRNSSTALNAQPPPQDTSPYSYPGPESKETRSSMFYNVLPTVVQARLPRLPSIRRSISSIGEIGGRAMHAKSKSIIDTDSESSGTETPPPNYTSRRTSRRGSDFRGSRASMMSTDTEEFGFGDVQDLRDDVSERPVSSMSTPPPFTVLENRTGINWKYANQGISLLTQAYQESALLSHDPDETSTVLTRQLYLHGMTYLLRGLPSELTTEERMSLHAAIPGSLVNPSSDPNLSLVPRSRNADLAHPDSLQPPSVLHRITATIVFQLFVLFQFLLPYIKLFIGQAYRWEREHKVAQRFMNGGITAVDELGRRTLQLSQTVCRMNDGKVGQAINDMTIWWVQGITGGLQQGINEGIVVIGEREASPNSKGKRIEKQG